MKKVFLASFITILSVSAILAGIYYYQKIKMQRTQVLDAIPDNASFIIQTKDITQVFASLKKSSYWKELHTIPFLNMMERRMAFLDSLTGRHVNLKDLMLKQGVTMSMHKTGVSEFSWLFLVGITDFNPEKSVNEAVNEIISDRIPIAKRLFDGVSIIEMPVYLDGRKEQFSYTVLNGLFIASFSPVLLEQSIREIKKNTQNKKGESFRLVVDAASSNAEVNVYVNYSQASQFLGKFLSPENMGFPGEAGDFAAWSGFDLKYKEHGVCLNGLTTVNNNSYLSCFQEQEPQEVQVPRIIPSSAAFMLYWGVSDFSRYYKKYKAYLASSAVKSQRYKNWVLRDALIRNTERELGVDLVQSMFSWVGSEMALVHIDLPDTVLEDNVYAIFSARNIETAQQSLNMLREKSGGDSLAFYNDYRIGKVNIEMLLPRLLGSSFSSLKNTFYTAVGNYIVFANSESSLRYFIDENSGQRVLYREDHYQSLASSISSRASFFMYSHLPGSLHLLKEYVSDSLVKDIGNNYDELIKFGSLGVQYIADPQVNAFFTNICFQKPLRKLVQTDVKEEWKLQLDSTVSMSPQYVSDNLTGDKEIIVQDDGNKLYLINKEGQILWSRQLPSKIMGRIYQVDAFRNNRLQFLFNTRLGLYLIDRNGNNVDKFPLRFKVPSSNAVAVFDYENSRDYRIFVGGIDGVVYAYKVDGTQVEGWTFTKPIWPVKLPVQHFSHGGKDYLLVSDSKGTTYILDRRGEKLAIADKPLYRSVNNRWVMDTADQPYFLTTDSTGYIFILYPSGTTEVERITEYKPSHYFDFQDVNGDKLKDYIILSDGYLFVCNQDTTRIFDYVFPESASKSSLMMKYFSGIHGDPVIGIVSPRANKLYLFNQEGAIRKGFPVNGSTLFDVVEFNSSGKKRGRQYIIIGSSDKNIYQYSID